MESLLKKNTVLFMFALLLVSTTSFGQGLPALRHCSVKGFSMDFYILTNDKKVRFNDTLQYFWFKAQKVHQTRGAASGNLLHGNFSKYFASGQLAEKGHFRYGLKEGDWLCWYPSGQLKSITRFKKGIRHGQYQHFTENGGLEVSQRYKNGKIKPDRKLIKAQKKLDKEALKEGENSQKDEPSLSNEKDSTRFFGLFNRKKEEEKNQDEDANSEPFFKRIFKGKSEAEKEAQKENRRLKREERRAARAVKKTESNEEG